MNFCISANSLTKKYECKTTHSATPFLKVDTQYLDLTTKTTSGLNIKVKHNNMTYRPLQTATSTSNRSSQYISTSGYSGISSRSSQYTSTSGYTGKRTSSKQITQTTGYSGTSKRNSTSGYSGRSSRSSQYTSTSAYQITSYTYTLKTNSSSTAALSTVMSYLSKAIATKTGTSSTTKTMSYSYQLYGYRNSTSTQSVTNAPIEVGTISNLTMTLTKNGSTLNISSTQAYVNCWYTCSVNFKTPIAIMRYSRAYPSSNFLSKLASEFKLTYNNQGAALTKTASRTSAYTTSATAIGNLTSTTALTRTSAYKTSSTAVGNMSSTTALTKTASASTIVNASSTTTNAVLLSTTVLTRTASRSSAYNTSAVNASVLSSTTALTKTASRTSQYEIITEI